MSGEGDNQSPGILNLPVSGVSPHPAPGAPHAPGTLPGWHNTGRRTGIGLLNPASAIRHDILTAGAILLNLAAPRSLSDLPGNRFWRP